VNQTHLPNRAFTKLMLRVPPVPEQEKICGFLNEQTAELDRLILEADNAIGLLRERRAALISAAVTGKIDVRGEVSEATEAA
jgi:type I restriction enzyme S subunit